MKIILSLIAVAIVGASALPQFINNDENIKFIPIIERTEVRDPSGDYAYRYVTGNGITFNEKGALSPSPDGKYRAIVQEGDFTYTAPNGQIIRTKYVADHYGFRAVGDHLPKSVVA